MIFNAVISACIDNPHDSIVESIVNSIVRHIVRTGLQVYMSFPAQSNANIDISAVCSPLSGPVSPVD